MSTPKSAENKPHAYILMGPSGNGKSSLARALETKTDGPYYFERIKPWTTRRQRNPQDDDYVFVSPEKFETAKEAGEFEAVMGSYGNEFGITPYQPSRPNAIPLYILTPSNALSVFNAGNSRRVFIDRYPIDYEATLRQRDPNIDPRELQIRLGKISAERMMADDIADLEFHNDVPLEQGVELLYRILVDDIERRAASSRAA